MRTLTKVLIWIVILCAVFLGVILAFFEPWTIPSDDEGLANSVEPTLSAGDLVLVSRSGNPTEGLLRCADPDAPGRYVVGRLMGRGGDTMDFVGGTLQIDKKIPSAPYACETAKVTMKNPASGDDVELNCFVEEFAGGTHESLRASKNLDRDSHTEVPAGTIFIVSDNRVLHLDSRDFGTVNPATCQRIGFRVSGSSGIFDAKKRFTILW